MVLSITPNVTSMFGANHISSILFTIVSILQTALLPMYSKLCDRIGRAEAYTLSIVIYSLAFIVMAIANSYTTLMVCCFSNLHNTSCISTTELFVDTTS